MKKMFSQVKDRFKHTSRRSLALTLCALVLLTMIGVGSVLTVIAKTGTFADPAKSGSQNASDGDVALMSKGDSDLAGAGYDCSYISYAVSKDYDNDQTVGELKTNKVNNDTIAVTHTSTSWYFYSASNDENFGNTMLSNIKPAFSYTHNGSTWTGAQVNSSTGANSKVNPNDGAIYWIENYCKGTGQSGLKISAPVNTKVTVKFNSTNSRYDITAEEAAPSYTINYSTPEHGSFSSKPVSAKAGDTVTFTTTPATGYQTGSVTVTNGGSSVDVTNPSTNRYSFTMPAAEVTVSATFTPVSYTITTTNPDNGTITANKNTANYGETITLTAAADTDYAIKSVTVKQGANTIPVTPGTGNTYTFMMPAGNVTVTATTVYSKGTVTIYFKSSTAAVYKPILTIDGQEYEMELGDDPEYLTQPKSHTDAPRGETGSLRFAWYKAEVNGIDTSRAVTVNFRGETYDEMDASLDVQFLANHTYYFGCDDLMDCSTLVNLSAENDAVKNFYDNPRHMIATDAEKASLSD